MNNTVTQEDLSYMSILWIVYSLDYIPIPVQELHRSERGYVTKAFDICSNQALRGEFAACCRVRNTAAMTESFEKMLKFVEFSSPESYQCARKELGAIVDHFQREKHFQRRK